MRPEKSEVERLLGSNEKITRLTNWRPKFSLDQGLAETIATDLVPQNGHRNEVMSHAREQVQAHRGLRDLFMTGHIEGWQYPVAENLCAFMISANKQGYVAFINGVKDGQSVDQSMEKNFGAGKERLMAAYVDSMGIRKTK